MIELTLKNYINFLFQILKLKVKILVTQLIQLNIFQSTFPKKFVLLIGNDSLINFDKWFNFKEMLSLIEIGVLKEILQFIIILILSIKK